MSQNWRSKVFPENEGIFAIHPIAFQYSSDIVPHRKEYAPYKTTNRGLEIEIAIEDVHEPGKNNVSSKTGVLSCHYETDLDYSIGLTLDQGSDRYYRKKVSPLVLLEHEKAVSATLSTVYIHKWGKQPTRGSNSRYCSFRRVPPEFQFSKGIVVEATVTSVSDKSKVSCRPGELVAE